MNDQLSASMQHCIGQVQSLCDLLDEPTTLLTIQSDGQTIAARAYGQIALDLRALPRGATICATLHDVSPDYRAIIAFTIFPI